MSVATVLVADDDRAIRTVLTQALGRAGYRVRTTGSASTLWKWVNDGDGDLVITDVVMPDENGLNLIPRIRRIRPNMNVIVMSAQNTLITAVEAADRGAFEYLPKPFDLRELISTVEKALHAPMEEANDPYSLPPSANNAPLVGRSSAMQDIYRTIARLTQTDLTALITGESGTGKELVAKALHDFGPRKNSKFIALSMAAIPKDLVESELFGHEKGAFANAAQRYVGRFQQADGGTLFLDEVGDMPLDAQTRLLRVLQDGVFNTVGGRVPIQANVRVIAATNRDLAHLVREGLFRDDLYYRLNVVPIRIPPLRDRVEDIPDLVRHFAAKLASDGLPVKSFSARAVEEFQAHSWPGNVRELENLVRRIAALYSQEQITGEIVRAELQESASVNDFGVVNAETFEEAIEQQLRHYFKTHRHSLPQSGLHGFFLEKLERPLIRQTLKLTRGNQIRAANILGVNRNTLRKRIKELNIEVVRGNREIS